MIEKVLHKNRLFALIVRGKFRKKSGINFFTQKKATQQFGYMKHKRNHIIKPHNHNKRLTKILSTTEVILLLKGTLRVDFYDNKKEYLFSKIIKAKQIENYLIKKINYNQKKIKTEKLYSIGKKILEYNINELRQYV